MGISSCQGLIAFSMPSVDQQMMVDRELRRESVPGAGSKREPSARPPRASAPTHMSVENMSTHTGGRRSPRLGNFGGGRLPRAPAATRMGFGQDITNMDRCRNIAGKPAKMTTLHTNSVPQVVPSTLRPAAHTLPRPLDQEGHKSVPVPPPTVPVTISSAIAQTSSPQDGISTFDESSNIQHVGEYANEIFASLFKEESIFLPRPNYMESQSDINGKMRAILIDWLVEVHMKYKLRPETLFLTVNLIDRYLTRMPVMRKRLQLVGVVAMFIAAKFEEIHPPEVADFVYITDSAYTKEDILTMECQMLSTLDFQIVVPTAAHFMDRMQRLNGCDGVQREIAQYLIELALLDFRMIRHTPSHLCSAALMLSNELLGRARAWPELLVQHARHTEVQLRPCSEELRALLDGAPAHWLQAVRKKFLLPPHHEVAKMRF